MSCNGCGVDLDSFLNSGKKIYRERGKGEVLVMGRTGSAREGFAVAAEGC